MQVVRSMRAFETVSGRATVNADDWEYYKCIYQ